MGLERLVGIVRDIFVWKKRRGSEGGSLCVLSSLNY